MKGKMNQSAVCRTNSKNRKSTNLANFVLSAPLLKTYYDGHQKIGIPKDDANLEGISRGGDSEVFLAVEDAQETHRHTH